MQSEEKKSWVDIVFPHPPLQRFTYEVPDHLKDQLQLGHRVLVPLGRRKISGFVVANVTDPPEFDLRTVEDILDPYPLLTPDLLELTRWIADYYLAHWGEVIRAALPPGIHRKSGMRIHFNPDADKKDAGLTDLQQEILQAVEAQTGLSLQALGKRVGASNIQYALNRLELLNRIRIERILEEAQVRVLSEKWISLSDKIDLLDIEALSRRAPKQARTLRKLRELSGEVRRSDLEVDAATLRRLEDGGWIETWQEEKVRDYYASETTEPPKAIQLTDEQRTVVNAVGGHVDARRFHVILLHGITSSGKTQVYIEAIRKVIDEGRTALVLIPEISLTPQAVQRYRGVFGDRVAVLHSRMSPGERFDSWRKIREGHFRIALGPRSAVFAPLENLGLIVVDEEHETSYKQIDPAPRYHARDAAVIRAQLNACPVLLGSATPSLESYYNANEGKYSLCRLTHRIDHIPLPRISIVPGADKNDPDRVFSTPLKEKIHTRIDEGEQVILLQNRRGYANFIRCSACGEIEQCPHCDISLTYHQKYRTLQCHYCGFSKPASDACGECGGASFKYKGAGTQRVEEDLKTLFLDTQIFRMDQDTTRRKGAHDKIITRFERGEADILIGTQMVAKGHDFPGVSLVGIVNADTGLYFPDFRSGERTFQLLVQAAGRAGRRNQGEVVIQTQSPEHPVLRFASQQDYPAFYAWEIAHRQELNYPPYGRLVLIHFRGPKEERVSEAAEAFAHGIGSTKSIERLGPVAAPLARIKNMYRFHLILRSAKVHDPSGRLLRQTARNALIRFDKSRYPDVRLNLDVDPTDTL